MDYDNREKNPIFFPALIAALLLPAGVMCGDFGPWMLVTPFVALILSLVGLVISKKLQARFAGCVLTTRFLWSNWSAKPANAMK